jgi:hypothetical protein
MDTKLEEYVEIPSTPMDDLLKLKWVDFKVFLNVYVKSSGKRKRNEMKGK